MHSIKRKDKKRELDPDEQTVGHQFDLLGWWRENEFPAMKGVAMAILSAQPSSSRSEATFSIGGFLISELRSCFLVENGAAAVTLHENIPDEPESLLQILREENVKL